MKTLYITDLDGTLLNREAQLSQRSQKMIGTLIQKGINFTIATARSQSGVKFLRQLGVNLPSVHLNGVLLYDNTLRKYVDCTPMDTETALTIIRILKEFDRMSFVYKFDSDCGINVEFERLTNDVERNFFEVRTNGDYKSFRQVRNITATDEDRVIYFTMVDEYRRLYPIWQEISRLSKAKATLYRDNYSDLYFLEVFSSEATKASGVLKIKERIGAEKVVAFGDNLNDIEMLRIADVGIAVGDGVEELKECADLVIGRSYEDGVAEYLWQTLMEKNEK